MSARRFALIAGAWVVLSGLAACAALPAATSPGVAPSADTAAPVRAPDTSRFYHQRPYGSDAQFNPLTVVLNEGYDMYRLRDDRRVFELPYAASFHVVWHSITDPEPVIRHYGWGAWLRNEVFPLTFKGPKGGAWVPNYHLHLFGSGMTWVRTTEWFVDHGVAHPKLAAGLTMYAGHFINEILENAGYCCEDEDGMTDLLIFDSGAMVLWNQPWMRRAFSGRIEMTDWYGQPSLSLPSKRLENTFSMFMVRAPLPKTDHWRIMTTGGNAFLLGISRRAGAEYWVTAAGGEVPVENPITDPTTGSRTVRLHPNIGLFVDRNGSLLASFLGLNGSANGATLNVYPGVLHLGGISPGFFAQRITGGPEGHGLRWGVISRAAIGVGGVAR